MTMSKAIVLSTRNESHKMIYRHFEVMKSLWDDSPNVEPVLFAIDSILENFASLIKE